MPPDGSFDQRERVKGGPGGPGTAGTSMGGGTHWGNFGGMGDPSTVSRQGQPECQVNGGRMQFRDVWFLFARICTVI